MGYFSGKTDNEINTLLGAVPTDWYQRSQDVPDRDEYFKALVLETLSRVLTSYMAASFSVTTGITASTTQTQAGGTALTTTVNNVTTVANSNDAVTMPTAVAGKICIIFNNGANTMKIFPAVGDDNGAGVDTAATLAAAGKKCYIAKDATTWLTLV